MTAEWLSKNFEQMVITSERLKKFSNGRPERLNGRSKNFLWMAFFKLNIPGLAAYFDNSAVYFKLSDNPEHVFSLFQVKTP